MTNPLETATIPVVPELLKSWGIRGQLLYTQLTQSLQGADIALKVMRDYDAGDKAIEEYILKTENELTKRYADVKAENEKADTADNEKRDAEIKAIKDKYEAAKAERDANAEAIREEIAADSGIERVDEKENAEAVEMWDMVRTAIDSQRSLAMDTLANKSVPNPNHDPADENSKEKLSIGDVIQTVKLPDIGIGKKARASSKSSDTAFRPRWNKTVVNGEELADPTVQSVAETLGITRDNLLASFLRFHSREAFEAGEQGSTWNFSVGPVEKDGEKKTYQLTVTKGTWSKKN